MRYKYNVIYVRLPNYIKRSSLDNFNRLQQQPRSHTIERTTPPSTRKDAPFVPEDKGLQM